MEHSNNELYGQKLSPRELEVLSMIADGKRMEDISKELFLSIRTVRNYLYNSYKKIGVYNKNAMCYAVVYYYKEIKGV